MPTPRYDGESGLWAADDVLVATDLLFAVFGPDAPAGTRQPAYEATSSLTALAGISASFFSVPPAAVEVRCLESLLLWERALVAARTPTGSDSPTYLALLRRGPVVLRAPDPPAEMRRLLGR